MENEVEKVEDVAQTDLATDETVAEVVAETEEVLATEDTPVVE